MRLPNTELAALAPARCSRRQRDRFTGPIQIVFPPVGLVGFGPFH